jgi:hypothetical protein
LKRRKVKGQNDLIGFNKDIEVGWPMTIVVCGTWWVATEATKFTRGEMDSNKGMCERNLWRRYEESNLEGEDCSPKDEYGVGSLGLGDIIMAYLKRFFNG